MNFKHYLTLENFTKIIKHDAVDTSEITHEWRQKHELLAREHFYTPLLNFLIDKNKKDGLSKINYSEGHSTYASELWNKIVDQKEIKDTNTLSDLFYKVLSNATFNYDKEALTQSFIINRYNALITQINEGNFKPYQLGEDCCLCHECGQKFKISINLWDADFKVFEKNADNSLNHRNLVKPQSCLENSIVQVQVDFPTGHLIVADWPRLREFTETVDYKGQDKWDNEKGLNTAKGRIFLTTHYAQQHNFIYVSVGNSSPYIFQKGDSLIVGQKDLDDDIQNFDGFEEKTNVCTDVWGVTLIDKQTMLEILTKSLGDNAHKVLEDYLKCNKQSITVAPGKYNVDFHGDYYKFNDCSEEDELPQEIEKFFTVNFNSPILEKKIKLK